MESWFKKWGDAIHVEDHSTGGYEHIWDIEAPLEAIDEIPTDWLCMSKWSSPDIFNKKDNAE